MQRMRASGFVVLGFRVSGFSLLGFRASGLRVSRQRG